MHRRGAVLLAVLLATGAARAQEPVRVEAQSIAAPSVVGFHPKNDAWVLVGDGADRVRLLDFTDPARPFVRLTLPASPPAGFLPDGRIVTGGRDGLLRVWTETGREALAPLKVSEKVIQGLAVSPSGKLIAIQDGDRTLHIVSLEGRIVSPPIPAKREKAGNGDDAECSDPEFGSSTPRFSHDERVIVFTTLCGYVAAVGVDGKRIPIEDADDTAVQTMDFARDGKTLMVRFIHQPGASTYTWRYENGRFGPAVKLPEPMTNRDIQGIAPGAGRNAFLVAMESRIQGVGADGRATEFGFDVPGARNLAVNADGSRIAVSLEHSVVLFGADGRPLAPAPFQQFVGTRGIAVIPGGDAILAANELGELNVWGTDGHRIGRPVRIRPAAETGEDLRWEDFAAAPGGAPGEIVVATSDGYVSVLRRDGTQVSGPIRLPGYGGDNSVRAMPAPSGTAIVAPVTGDQLLRLYDGMGRPLGRPFALHGRYIDAVGISADGKTIATVSSGGTAGPEFQLWSAEGQKIGDPVALDRRLGVERIRFSPDGRSVVVFSTSYSGGFAILRRGETPFVEPAGDAFVGFLRDGGAARTEDGRIAIEAADGRVRQRVSVHMDYTVRAVLPDGARALVHDGLAMRILPLEALAKPADRPSIWNASESAFAAAAPGGDLRIVFRDGRLITMPLGQPARTATTGIVGVQMGHVSPDGTRIVIDENTQPGRHLRIFDDEGNVLAPPIGGYFVAFTPDSSRIAVGVIDDGRRSSLAAYDRNGAPLWRAELGDGAIGRMAYAHDGERLAVSIDGTIRFFDRDGRPTGTPIDTGMKWMSTIAPAPDGGWLVLGGDEAMLHFYSAAGARIGAPVAIPTGRIGRAQYTPDGRHILTRDDGGTIRLWTRTPAGTLEPAAVQANVPYYSSDHGFAGRQYYTASRHILVWYDPMLRPIASTLLLADGHLVTLADGRHCGAGPAFANRRAFRGAVELPAAERDALVDCAAVRAALGGR